MSAPAAHEVPSDSSARPQPAPQRSHDENPRAEASAGAYSFSDVTNSEQRLEDIFRSERIDPVWSSQTVDSLNLVMSAMPERSVIGDYGLTCKDSLCKLEIKGSQEQISGQRAENNLQVAMHRIMQQPPASEIFDDKDNQATITLFAHRRKSK